MDTTFSTSRLFRVSQSWSVEPSGEKVSIQSLFKFIISFSNDIAELNFMTSHHRPMQA
eukprot:jgi/Mesvir1/7455/Mv25810-RA.1